MKVGDLIYDDYYGVGVILEIEHGEASIHFCEEDKKCWLDEELFASVEVISESR